MSSLVSYLAHSSLDLIAKRLKSYDKNLANDAASLSSMLSLYHFCLDRFLLDNFQVPAIKDESSFINEQINSMLEIFYRALKAHKNEINMSIIKFIQNFITAGFVYGRCVDADGNVKLTLEWIIEIVRLSGIFNDNDSSSFILALLQIYLSMVTFCTPHMKFLYSILKQSFELYLICKKMFGDCTESEIMFQILTAIFASDSPYSTEDYKLTFSFFCEQAESSHELTRQSAFLIISYAFKNNFLHECDDSIKEIIKKKLIPALANSFYTKDIKTFNFILDIYSELFLQFIDLINNDIESIILQLYLPQLERSVPIKRRFSVVSALQYVFQKNSDFLPMIFLTFDCDIKRSNLLEKIFIGFANILQEKGDQLLNIHIIIINFFIDSFTGLYNVIELQTKEAKSPIEVSTNNDTDSKFEKQFKNKLVFDEGNSLFSKNPEQGIKFFIEKNVIENSPNSIASYLFEMPLDKASIGDYIGGKTSLQQSVLTEYANLFDFKGLEVDEALRLFLSKFRIPGESQVIDRIMEAFGARYFTTGNLNDRYNDADSVYMIAFAIIMLSTDLHSKSIINHIDTQSWLKMINKDLNLNFDEDYLLNIYNRIKEQAFQLDCEHFDSFSQKEDHFKISINTYLHSIETIRSLFGIIWSPAHAGLGHILSMYSIPDILTSGYNGVHIILRLACLLHEEKAITESVSTLCEIRPNFLLTLNEALSAAEELGEYFDEDWIKIFKVISIALRYKAENKISESNENDINNLLEKSSQLSNRSFIHFVKALCFISLEELRSENPTTALLSKLIDISACNMNRVRFVWIELWTILQIHFVESGSHKNTNIAITVINTLLKLSVKFLERTESSHFNFQMKILKPFEIIFLSEERVEIKEIILNCIYELITLQGKNLRSGWMICLNILMESINDNTNLAEKGFNVSLEMLKNIKFMFNDYNKELIDYYSKFVCVDHVSEDLNISALANLIYIVKFICNLTAQDTQPFSKINVLYQEFDSIFKNLTGKDFSSIDQDNRLSLYESNSEIVSKQAFNDDSIQVELIYRVLNNLRNALKHPNKTISKEAISIIGKIFYLTSPFLSDKKQSEIYENIFIKVLIENNDYIYGIFSKLVLLSCIIFFDFIHILKPFFVTICNILAFYSLKYSTSSTSLTWLAIILTKFHNFLSDDDLRSLLHCFSALATKFNEYLDSIVFFSSEKRAVIDKDRLKLSTILKPYFNLPHFEETINLTPYNIYAVSYESNVEQTLDNPFNNNIPIKSLHHILTTYLGLCYSAYQFIIINDVSLENISLILNAIVSNWITVCTLNKDSDFRKNISGKALSGYLTSIEKKLIIIYTNSLVFLTSSTNDIEDYAEAIIYKKLIPIYFLYSKETRDPEIIKNIITNFLINVLFIKRETYVKNLSDLYAYLIELVLYENAEVKQATQRNFTAIESLLLE